MDRQKAYKSFCKAEHESGKALKRALSLPGYYNRTNFEILRRVEAFYLPAVNVHARLKWASACLQEICWRSSNDEKNERLHKFVFLITLADRAHITSARCEEVELQNIRRKFGGALQGLNYIGMIEPGYYNVIYDAADKKEKNMISWHGHFIVWGQDRRELSRWKKKISSRIEPVVPRRPAVHIKRIPSGQLCQRLCYIIKSPRTEYSIGRRSTPDRATGLPRYKQNKRKLRFGHRVQLFQLLRDVTLPKLAMAGGEGTELLRRIKYRALRDYRRRSSCA